MSTPRPENEIFMPRATSFGKGVRRLPSGAQIDEREPLISEYADFIDARARDDERTKIAAELRTTLADIGDDDSWVCRERLAEFADRLEASR